MGNAQKQHKKVLGQLFSLIEQGEENLMPWQKPWVSAPQVPTSAGTGKPFTGGNSIYLMTIQLFLGYRSGLWFTFKQMQSFCEEHGLFTEDEKGRKIHHIRLPKGESGWIAFRPHIKKETVTVEEGSQEIEYEVSHTFFSAYTVFNIDQFRYFTYGSTDEGQPVPMEVLVKMPDVPELEQIDPAQLWKNMPDVPTFSEANDAQAYYTPKTDTLNMPPKKAFKSLEGYLHALAHELIHSTGHKKRLGRFDANKFTSDGYSFEELVAEIGGVILLARMGMNIPQEEMEQSASYMLGWKRALTSNPEWFWKASSKAAQAVSYILGEE